MENAGSGPKVLVVRLETPEPPERKAPIREWDFKFGMAVGASLVVIVLGLLRLVPRCTCY